MICCPTRFRENFHLLGVPVRCSYPRFQLEIFFHYDPTYRLASELISNTQVRLNLVKGIGLNFPIMEDYIDEVERLDLVDLLTRRPKTVRDRFDPFGFFMMKRTLLCDFLSLELMLFISWLCLDMNFFHNKQKYFR